MENAPKKNAEWQTRTGLKRQCKYRLAGDMIDNAYGKPLIKIWNGIY